MPTVNLSPVFNAWQGFTPAGLPLAGGLLRTYLAGTTTPAATYTTVAGSVANANPIVLDASGHPPNEIWLVQGTGYQFVLTDALGLNPLSYDNIFGIGDNSAFLINLATAAGSQAVGWQQVGAGAVLRTVSSKLDDFVSVLDFGAVGDGTTDDTAAIQAAINTRKTVWLPKPTSFYKTTSALSVFYNSHLTGEEGVTTIVRRTSGSGSVLDFLGSNENALIENLRIGGIGTTGITVGGGGYANYLSTLSLRNVHFEADQLVNINANLIHCDFIDCTFGYFQQTSNNASLQHIISLFSGGNNTNVNLFTNCKFFNGSTTAASVTFSSGLVLTFLSCAWENNGRDLSTSNVQNCVLLNCYTERGKHATSQFDFGAARVRSKVLGGQFNGASMPAGASMFRAAESGPLLIEDADIAVTASAFAYQDATTTAHSLPLSGVHHFKDCRIQGNAADPLLYLDNIIEDAVNAFTPVPVSLTVVNGSGGATYSGTWSIRNRMVTVTFRIVTTGTCTTAATAGVTYFPLPTALPVPQVSASGGICNENTTTSLGVGLVYINGRFFPPVWGAQTGNIAMSMTYPI